ncbi:sigma-70 family RNA polymerase sigma factor [Persicobacter diffluens]|uniref:RNA polymerase sigma-70 factor n=1 Tax=Persicobacter diffluens TaxID=981 RepID=A0AAN4VZM5_9BACT|nr:RNA polymerase sigma-70 factor [Persicobacter diffluens]
MLKFNSSVSKYPFEPPLTKKSFERIFFDLFEPLRIFGMRFGLGAQESEDLVADVFCKLWEQKEDLQVKSSLKAYLFSAMRNKALNYKEQHGVSRQVGVEEAFEVAHDQMADQQQADELQFLFQQELQSFSNNKQQIFRLSRDEEMSYKEIAEVMGISIKTVESHMSEVLKALRKVARAYR